MKAVPVLLGIILFMAATVARAQVLTPIPISFTGAGAGDVVVLFQDSEESLVPLGNTSYLYYEQGEAPAGVTGLPDNGEIVDPATGSTFQLLPYTGVNALNSDGTITLQTPAAYSSIGFLVNDLSRAGRQPLPVTFVLNFEGDSPTQLTIADGVPFWTDDPSASGGEIAFSGTGVYDPSLPGTDYTTYNLDEYDFTLSAADAGKVLDSIDVESDGTQLVTYAVSGIDPELPTPEPGTAGLLLAGLGAAVFLRCCRRLAIAAPRG